MPHYPKPFFRKSRGLWYVQFNGKQINLGPDQHAAFQQYHELMRQPEPRIVRSCDSVVVLIDKFLDWVAKHRASETYLWYQARLQRFVERYPDLTVADLKPFHVQEWIDAFDLAPGSKRNLARAIQRAMRWCEKQGYIDRSPIAHFEKPADGKREKVITPAEYEWILSLVRNNEFRDLLIVTWETGCRPQESLAVEARHVDLKNCRWRFPKSESKGKKHERVVYLNDTAMEITRRLMKRYPTGPLFRNTNGKPWTTDAINCAFVALQTRMGLQKLDRPKVKRKRVPAAEKDRHEQAMKDRRKQMNALARQRGEKYCLYHFRHSWINRMLTSGVDSLTVAILAGHVDPSMIAKTYQHLSQNPAFLLEQAKKAAG